MFTRDCRLIFKLLKQAIFIERHFFDAVSHRLCLAYLLLKDIDLLRCPAAFDVVTKTRSKHSPAYTHD